MSYIYYLYIYIYIYLFFWLAPVFQRKCQKIWEVTLEILSGLEVEGGGEGGGTTPRLFFLRVSFGFSRKGFMKFSTPLGTPLGGGRGVLLDLRKKESMNVSSSMKPSILTGCFCSEGVLLLDMYRIQKNHTYISLNNAHNLSIAL